MTTSNPFFSKWDTPFEIPPFDLIKDAHFADAFDEAFKQSRTGIDKVANATDAPTFANTIEALEMVWLPSFLNGIVMCQGIGIEPPHR